MLTTSILLALGSLASQGPQPLESESAASPPQATKTQRIVWYTDLDQALAEAKRTNRPIFLQSAAPRCQDVPGLW
jgi:uncharacterized protein YyaL (SSP411 family)